LSLVQGKLQPLSGEEGALWSGIYGAWCELETTWAQGSAKVHPTPQFSCNKGDTPMPSDWGRSCRYFRRKRSHSAVKRGCCGAGYAEHGVN